jgi:hypothetical protein
MESVFTILNGDKAPDRWRCTCESYREFLAAESSGSLGEAMSHWRLFTPFDRNRTAKPVEGDPMRDDGRADPGSLEFHDFNAPPSVRLFKPSLADACYADVSAPSPHDFLWSTPGFAPVRLENIASAILQKSLAWDLLVCKELAHPFYHRIEQEIDTVVHRYRRLLLPVADNQGKIGRIYAFCQPLVTHGAYERKQATKLI